MRMRHCFLLAAMAVLLAMTVTAADVSGKWNAQVPGRGGQTRDTTFNLKVDGDKLTGAMTGPQGDVEIKDGTISGNNISFKVNLEFNGNSIVLLFKGVASGDQIKFTREREGAGQTQEFTAKRAR
jgi:hypothetical protein